MMFVCYRVDPHTHTIYFSDHVTTTTISTTEWRSKRLLDGSSNSIGYADIGSFRVGRYEDADNNVQAKWCHVMLHFLPHICTAYLGWNFKKTKAVSSVATPSDEALLYWYLDCYVAGWEKEKEEADRRAEEQLGAKDPADSRKKRKKEGQHYSRTKLGSFVKWLKVVDSARQDQDTGSGWDDALKAEATSQQALERTGLQLQRASYGDAIPEGEAQMQITPLVIIPYTASGNAVGMVGV